MELLAGDAAAAEVSLRSGFEALQQMGEHAFLSTTAAFLARAVFAQERIDEAEELARLSARLSASGDLVTQVMWRSVQARILARRGPAMRRPKRWRVRRSRWPNGPTSSSTAETPSSISRTSCATQASVTKPRQPQPRACIFTSKRAISSPPGESDADLSALL